MTGKLIIYGATGYTGQLVSEQAGLDFIVAGQETGRSSSRHSLTIDRNFQWRLRGTTGSLSHPNA